MYYYVLYKIPYLYGHRIVGHLRPTQASVMSIPGPDVNVACVTEAVEPLKRVVAVKDLPSGKRPIPFFPQQLFESAKRQSLGMTPGASRLDRGALGLRNSPCANDILRAPSPPILEPSTRPREVQEPNARSGTAGLDQAMNALIKDWCTNNGVPSEAVPQWIFSNRFWRHNRGETDAREWGLRRTNNPQYPGLVAFSSIARGDVDDNAPASGGQPGGHFFFICKMVRKLVQLSDNPKLKPLLYAIPDFKSRAEYKDNVGRFRDVISGYRAKVESERRATGPCRKWSTSSTKKEPLVDYSDTARCSRGKLSSFLTEDCHIAAEELAALAAPRGCPSPTITTSCGASTQDFDVSSTTKHGEVEIEGCPCFRTIMSPSNIIGVREVLSSSGTGACVAGLEEKKAGDCRLAAAAELALLAENW